MKEKFLLCGGTPEGITHPMTLHNKCVEAVNTLDTYLEQNGFSRLEASVRDTISDKVLHSPMEEFTDTYTTDGKDSFAFIIMKVKVKNPARCAFGLLLEYAKEDIYGFKKGRYLHFQTRAIEDCPENVKIDMENSLRYSEPAEYSEDGFLQTFIGGTQSKPKLLQYVQVKEFTNV